MRRAGLDHLLVAHASRGPREGRVHDDQVRLDALREDVVELLGVLGENPIDSGQGFCEIDPALGNLVGVQAVQIAIFPERRHAGDQRASAHARREHDVALLRVPYPLRQEGVGRRRAELLGRNLLFGALCLGGQARGGIFQGGDYVQRFLSISRQRTGHAWAIDAIDRGFEGIVGVLGDVLAIGLGAAIRLVRALE